MPKVPPDFENNVFINCPFDKRFVPLFNAIVFTVHDVGLRPRCGLEASNAGEFRLKKIMDIISKSKYSIHDLSCTELDATSELPRFNMPLELGIDLGCRSFGRSHHRKKILLILDVEEYRYQKFISDISGQDIYAHGGNEKRVIRVVRDWLRQEQSHQTVLIPGGEEIYQRYKRFQKATPSICAKLKLDQEELPFVDFSYIIAYWLKANLLGG